MACEQLSFIPETYEEKIDRRIKEMDESLNKVRRALFARHGELAKLYLETSQELETLKEAICRGKYEYANTK